MKNINVLSRGDLEAWGRKGQAMVNLPMERVVCTLGCQRCGCLVVRLAYFPALGQLEAQCPACGASGMRFQVAEGHTCDQEYLDACRHMHAGRTGSSTY